MFLATAVDSGTNERPWNLQTLYTTAARLCVQITQHQRCTEFHIMRSSHNLYENLQIFYTTAARAARLCLQITQH
jgi:hypothetical protein